MGNLVLEKQKHLNVKNQFCYYSILVFHHKLDQTFLLSEISVLKQIISTFDQINYSTILTFFYLTFGLLKPKEKPCIKEQGML